MCALKFCISSTSLFAHLFHFPTLWKSLHSQWQRHRSRPITVSFLRQGINSQTLCFKFNVRLHSQHLHLHLFTSGLHQPPATVASTPNQSLSYENTLTTLFSSFSVFRQNFLDFYHRNYSGKKQPLQFLAHPFIRLVQMLYIRSTYVFNHCTISNISNYTSHSTFLSLQPATTAEELPWMHEPTPVHPDVCASLVL